MIVPNLMVTDMARSIAFYSDVVGMTLSFAVMPDREMSSDDGGEGAVFAMLEWEGG